MLLAGVSVGYVGDVTLRRAGYLDVLLKINDKYKVPKGSKATVKAIGIFGDVAVALTPPVPAPAHGLRAGRHRAAGHAGGRRRPDHESRRLDRPDDVGVAHGAQSADHRRRHVQGSAHDDRRRRRRSPVSCRPSIAEQNKNVTETMRSFSDAARHLSNTVDSAQLQAIDGQPSPDDARTPRGSSRISIRRTRQFRACSLQAQNGNGTVGKLLTDSLLYSDVAPHCWRALDSLIADFKANPKKYINLRIF